jgi:hypothetical protein
MNIYRKMLIVLIIVITGYLLYRLLQKKQEMQLFLIKENQEQKIEGLTFFQTPSMKNTTNTGLPLREYFIKASMNSAYDKNGSMRLDTLTNVMSRGCRFLDFEIYSVKGAPVVAYSSAGDKGSFESSNYLALNDVLNKISTSAFSSVSPNPEDPLFLFLRFKTTRTDIYRIIKQILDMNFNGMFYTGKINKDTKLYDLKQKIILIMDNTYYLGLQKTPSAFTEYNTYIFPYVNAFCGTIDFPLTTNVSMLNQASISPQIHEDGITTDVTKWQISIPESINAINPLVRPFITEYGVNIVPYRFYLNDNELENYEELFSENGAVAFVSMATALLYMKNNLNNLPPE